VLAGGARLEWLPLENLVHIGAQALNAQRFALAPGAEMIGWDLLALGLPAAGAPFVGGRACQRIEVEGAWLDAASIAAADRALLESPLGLAGCRALGTLGWACGSAIEPGRVEAALAAAREAIDAAGLDAGATRVASRVVVVRALGHRIEPLFTLWAAIRGAWRTALWGLPATVPRVWST